MNIAAARHMTTTAEGVETKQQLELLRALGCTEMQGYLFSPAKAGRRNQATVLRAPAKISGSGLSRERIGIRPGSSPGQASLETPASARLNRSIVVLQI